MKATIKHRIFVILNWVAVAWIAKVFLGSLPYKFSNHPDTQHIFGTIGHWMQGVLGEQLGSLFIKYGAYGVGSVELITSLILLAPLLLITMNKLNLINKTLPREVFHCIGGGMASGVMIGAVFFHLATPLGIEVLHEGKSDGGSLFYAAVSILLLGALMFVCNFKGCCSALCSRQRQA